MKRLSVIVCALCLSVSLAAQVKLSYNPAKGETYVNTAATSSTVKQNIMGQDLDVKQSQEMVLEYVITDNTAAGVVERVTIKGIKMQISSMMLTLNYDSKQPSVGSGELDGVFSKMLSVLIDKSFTMVQSSDGSVQSITGLDGLADAMMKAVEGDQMGQMLAPQIGESFSEAAMKQSVAQTMKFYPTVPVKAGDPWGGMLDLGNGQMNMALDIVYTLASVGDKECAITYVGTMKEGGDMTGDMTGTITVDTATGIPMRIESTIKYKGTVATQGMEIAIDGTQQSQSSMLKP
jgi:hypothetical protein